MFNQCKNSMNPVLSSLSPDYSCFEIIHSQIFRSIPWYKLYREHLWWRHIVQPCRQDLKQSAAIEGVWLHVVLSRFPLPPTPVTSTVSLKTQTSRHQMTTPDGIMTSSPGRVQAQSTPRLLASSNQPVWTTSCAACRTVSPDWDFSGVVFKRYRTLLGPLNFVTTVYHQLIWVLCVQKAADRKRLEYSHWSNWFSLFLLTGQTLMCQNT